MAERAGPPRARVLIEIDWIAGTTVGVFVLILRDWLAGLYVLPGSLVLVIGLANLAYGCASFVLARRRRGDRVPYLRVVAAANMAWAVACAVLAVAWFGRASPFGMAQLLGEMLFVGGLGMLEWRAAAR